MNYQYPLGHHCLTVGNWGCVWRRHRASRNCLYHITGQKPLSPRNEGHRAFAEHHLQENCNPARVQTQRDKKIKVFPPPPPDMLYLMLVHRQVEAVPLPNFDLYTLELK